MCWCQWMGYSIQVFIMNAPCRCNKILVSFTLVKSWCFTFYHTFSLVGWGLHSGNLWPLSNAHWVKTGTSMGQGMGTELGHLWDSGHGNRTVISMVTLLHCDLWVLSPTPFCRRAVSSPERESRAFARWCSIFQDVVAGTEALANRGETKARK